MTLLFFTENLQMRIWQHLSDMLNYRGQSRPKRSFVQCIEVGSVQFSGPGVSGDDSVDVGASRRNFKKPK